MKYIVLLLCCFSLVCAVEDSVSTLKGGVGLVAGTNGGGGSGRLWYNGFLGTSIQIFSDWGQEYEGGEASLLWKLPLRAPFYPYLLLGGGMQRLNITDAIPPEYNVIVGTMNIGAGGEYFLGNNKEHGLALELVYINGKVEYAGRSETTIGSSSMNTAQKEKVVTPLALRANYTFYFCPRLQKDNDGDGITKEDLCPEDAEDYDGFQDDDGCPDFDNDGDGVADLVDKCLNDTEDRDDFQDEDGCPDFDNDEDGIADSVDKCPNDTEDSDGFQDDDGCPELDNDEDGVADSVDKCPNSSEVYNSLEDSDGCPDTLPTVEEVIAEIPLERIIFEPYSATLAKESFPVLDTLITALLQWKEVTLEIQGHTDNSGEAISNKKISQLRASAVKEYLTKGGIKSERLTAVGYGEEKPVVSNETKEGRIQNRRVEFMRTDKWGD